MPFYRTKIKIKREIVTFLDHPINYKADRAESISPQNWNNFIRISMSTNIKNFKKGIDLLGLFLNAKK